MNTNSNTYTFIYASVMVILVAVVLAYVAGALQPRQQSNIDTEKRLNILRSAHIGAFAAAGDKNALVAQCFQKYVTRAYIVNSRGEVIEGDAFALDMKSQYELIRQIEGATPQQQERLKAQLRLPVFECTIDDGSLIYVVEVYGQGLWGPIWGYISFRDDLNTIYGVVFDHKGETPGLGAEIATPVYSKQFEGKTIFANGAFTSIAVTKGGARPGDNHAVDAISGGTITSKALESTISSCLNEYLSYFTLQMQ